MCEFNEYGVNHNYAEYVCSKCGEEMCWSCNPKDQRGSWHGESRCFNCDTVLVEGSFA